MPLAVIQPASRCYKVCHPSVVVMMGCDWRQMLPGLCLFTYIITVLLLLNLNLKQTELVAKHLVVLNILYYHACLYSMCWCILDCYKCFVSCITAVDCTKCFYAPLEILYVRWKLQDNRRVIHWQTVSVCCSWNEPMTYSKKLQWWSYPLCWKQMQILSLH